MRVLPPTKVFTGLDFPRQRTVEVSNLHGKTNAVRHEPRSFLSHAKVSRELVRRNSLLQS